MIKGIDKGKPVLLVECNDCGENFESLYVRGHMIKFIKEYGLHENFATSPCPNCGTLTFINVNLPSNELEEDFFNEMEMDEKGKEERRAVKIFIGELTFENG